jgi:hypothetical protein
MSPDSWKDVLWNLLILMRSTYWRKSFQASQQKSGSRLINKCYGEVIEEGYANFFNSLEVLQQMRQGLEISEKEHLRVLTELGVENPDLLNSSKQRTRENQMRLQSYHDQIAGMVGSKRRRER